MTLSAKAKLMAHLTVSAHYLVQPGADPSQLIKELKAVTSTNVQRCLDKMMPVVGYFENGRFVAVATCEDCAKENRWTSDSMPEPSVVIKKFRDRKWQVSKRRITCPQCWKRKKTPATVYRQVDKPMTSIGEALKAAITGDNVTSTGNAEFATIGDETYELGHQSPPAKGSFTLIDQPNQAEGEDQVSTETIIPTDKAKAAKRYAYSLLLEHYDDVNKRYNGDWSDRAIAERSKLSESAVAKIREEDFGPAGPPPQLIDLKKRITAMEERLRSKETAVLEAMDAIPEMQKDVALLKDQLASLVAAHGWSA